VGEVAAISPRHDQPDGGGGQSRRAVEEVLRCRGRATRKDEGMVASAEYASEGQSEPLLDPDCLFDTLSALAQKHQVPGAQLAIHYGGTTVAIEVGEVQPGTGRPITRDTAFPIGSITKTFTATLAMILVAEGDLELDAPLGEHIPELGDVGDVTLRQVLSHTGGFPVGPDSEELLTASMRRCVMDYCRRQNLVLPPGTGFSYSNLGYVLVGHLIETITRMTWWDAMKSIVLRPLRIEPTLVGAPEGRPVGRPLATGHSVNTVIGRTQPVKPFLALAEAPACGLATSAVDLVSLGSTLLSGRAQALLPVTYVTEMQRAVPHTEPIGWADGWGLGLAVFGNPSTAWVGHVGSVGGIVSNLRLDPVSRCVVAFTSNANTGRGMWDELVEELRREGLRLPIRDSNIEAPGRPTAPPPACVGRYLNGNIELSVAATDTGALNLAIDGNIEAELILFDDLSFSARDKPSVRLGRFLRDPITGDLERIQFTMYVGRRASATSEDGRCLTRAQALSA
jgi:CubicO group peptidase (beta-lactamase class C family)